MRMRVGTKLFMGFGIVVVILLGLSIYTAVQLNHLSEAQDKGYTRSEDAIIMEELKFMGEQAYRIIADAVINRNEKETVRDWTELKSELNTDLEMMDKRVDTDEERGWAREVRTAFAKLVETTEKELFPLIFGKLREVGINYEIRQLDDKIDTIIDEVKEPINKIAESFTAESIEADKEFDTTSKTILLVSIILSLIAILASIIIAIVITNGIRQPLNKGVVFAHKVADGDLTATVDVKTGDELEELASALNVTVGKLKTLIKNVIEAADQVAASSEEMSKTSQSISMGAQKQASALEQATASMEEMSSSVKQVAEKAQGQAASVEEVSSTIEEVSASIRKIADLAGNIRTADDSSRESAIAAMKRIEKNSQQINNIIGVISDIADQTNLLALNASIEAARAGEAGRGFAVVAKEISKLADKSANATKDIEELINQTTLNVTAGVDMVKMVAEATAEQQKASQQIEEAIQNVNQLSQVIASAAEEQSSTSDEMSRTLQGINQVTQQNAASSEEMASSTEELSSQAEELKNMVTQFKV